jgi:hypothetical protein
MAERYQAQVSWLKNHLTCAEILLAELSRDPNHGNFLHATNIEAENRSNPALY